MPKPVLDQKGYPIMVKHRYPPGFQDPIPLPAAQYPAWRYHATFPPICVQNAMEDGILDPAQWKDTPAKHGVVSCPSRAQLYKTETGFDWEGEKQKALARKELSLAKMAEDAVIKELDEEAGDTATYQRLKEDAKKRILAERAEAKAKAEAAAELELAEAEKEPAKEPKKGGGGKKK